MNAGDGEDNHTKGIEPVVTKKKETLLQLKFTTIKKPLFHTK